VQPEDLEEHPEEEQGRGKKGKSKTRHRPTTLTLDQKLDLATSELDATKRDNAQQASTNERTISMLEALLEQSEVRMEEMKREAYEFKRNVVLGGVDQRTGEAIAGNRDRKAEAHQAPSHMQAHRNVRSFPLTVPLLQARSCWSAW
jgi:hypothetical protein